MTVVEIQGLPWPSAIGDYTLMGPKNRLGRWRWYERSTSDVTVRIKLDSFLRLLDKVSIRTPSESDYHYD